MVVIVAAARVPSESIRRCGLFARRIVGNSSSGKLRKTGKSWRGRQRARSTRMFAARGGGNSRAGREQFGIPRAHRHDPRT